MDQEKVTVVLPPRQSICLTEMGRLRGSICKGQADMYPELCGGKVASRIGRTSGHRHKGEMTMTRLSAFLTGLFWISVTFAQSLPADPSRSVPSERSSAASLQTPASLAVGRVSSTPQHPSPPTVEAAPGKSQPVPQADDPELPKTTELPNYDSHRCSQVLPRRGQCTKLPPQADTVANRRLAFDRLRDRDSVTKLFNDLGPRFNARPGGYTRILKMGFRVGDNAPMALVELVDRGAVVTEENNSGAAA